MATLQNETFKNQNVVVDGHRFERCTFTNCGLIYEGGELPTFDRCKFKSVNIQLAGSALRTTQYLSGMYQGGMAKPVEAVLTRLETTGADLTGQRPRPYNPVYTGTNWGRLAGYSGLLLFVTVLLLAAFFYGLQYAPFNQVLRGDTPRPLTVQRTYNIMPGLPVELGETYAEITAAQKDMLNSYGWVDEANGIAHIPISQAMDLLLEQGLSQAQ